MAIERNPVADAISAIQLSEARWQAILETARDAIISIDERGRITLFNPAAQQVFGYEPREVRGRNVSMLMPSPYQEEHDQYLQNYRDSGIPKAIGRIREVEARRKNGEVFPIELSVSEARIGQQRLHTAIIRDVSERRRAEKQIADLQRDRHRRERLADIGAINAKVVHDIANPLAGLAMQAQLILRRADDPRLRDPAERIVEGVRRLDRLVHEFRAFARDQKLSLKEVALPPLLEALVDEWRPQGESRGIAVILDVEPAAAAQADEDQLRRVLDNLIRNSVEAIEHGPGVVSVSASSGANETTVLQVKDSGPGIPPGFDPFQLFETTKAKGIGLGLAIAKQIVVAHGGTISYEQGAPSGTLFTIQLPRHGPALP